MDVRIPLIAAIVGYWLLGLPIGAGLAFETSLGPIGLWCGLAIGLIVVAIILTMRLRRLAGGFTANHPASTTNVGSLAKP
jgi:MATE family, multidrug efflux pump